MFIPKNIKNIFFWSSWFLVQLSFGRVVVLSSCRLLELVLAELVLVDLSVVELSVFELTDYCRLAHLRPPTPARTHFLGLNIMKRSLT
jgi:hypothetical protein